MNRDVFFGSAQFLAWGDGPAGPWIKILLPDSDDLGPFRGMTAAKAKMAGQLLAVKIVEVDPDNPEPEPPAKPAHKPQMLSQYAAMLCRDDAFQLFLTHEYPERWISDPDTDSAAVAVRALCGIKSRSELDDPAKVSAIAKFHALREQYHEWMKYAG